MRDILIIILLIAVFGVGIILWPLAIIGGIILIVYLVSLANRPKKVVPVVHVASKVEVPKNHNVKVRKHVKGKRKILIVDDDAFLRDMWEMKIKQFGLDAAQIDHPTETFVDEVAEIDPDLIALDVLMPSMDGFAAIKLLKADRRTKNIPVIFASNMGQSSDIKLGLSLGAVDYIVIAAMTPTELVQSYVDFLNDSEHYVRRCDIFDEIANHNFSSGEERDAYFEKRLIDLGVKKPGMGYKLGMFVLANAVGGNTEYLTFKFKDKNTRMIVSDDYNLAIFNELMFANWYAVEMSKELGKSANGRIMEIDNQKLWDRVRENLMTDGVKRAVLNPCDGDGKHRCPIVAYDLAEYEDFDKLKESFAKHPNTHYTFEEEKK